MKTDGKEHNKWRKMKDERVHTTETVQMHDAQTIQGEFMLKWNDRGIPKSNEKRLKKQNKIGIAKREKRIHWPNNQIAKLLLKSWLSERRFHYPTNFISTSHMKSIC